LLFDYSLGFYVRLKCLVYQWLLWFWLLDLFLLWLIFITVWVLVLCMVSFWLSDLHRGFWWLFYFLCLFSSHLNLGQAFHCVLKYQSLSLFLNHRAPFFMPRNLPININGPAMLEIAPRSIRVHDKSRIINFKRRHLWVSIMPPDRRDIFPLSVNGRIRHMISKKLLCFIEIKLLVAGASGSDEMGLFIFPVVLWLLSVLLGLFDCFAILVSELSLNVGNFFGPFLLV
jgi:hypothetical protein